MKQKLIERNCWAGIAGSAVKFALMVCSLVLASASAQASDPVPVAVEISASQKKADPLAADIEDTVRTALNITGQFIVVRSDLAVKMARAQAKYLGVMYKTESGIEPGQFLAPRYIVKGKYKKKRKGTVKVKVSFVDMNSLAMVPNMNLSAVVPVDSPEDAVGELALQIAQNIQGIARGEDVSTQVKERIRIATAKANSKVANAAYRKARRLARTLEYSNLRAAEQSLTKALKADSKHIPSLLLLSKVLCQISNLGSYYGESDAQLMARFSDAMSLVARAQKISGDLWLVQRELARVFVLRQHENEYEKALANAKKTNPYDPELLFVEASAQKSPSSAIRLLHRVLRVDPLHLEARLLLAENLIKRGKIAAGRTEYITILKNVAPRSVITRIHLAEIEYASLEFSAAEKLLGQAKKMDPRSSLIKWRLALAKAVKRKDPEKLLKAALSNGSTASLILTVPHPLDKQIIKMTSKLHQRWPTHPMLGIELARRLLAVGQIEETREAVLVLRRVRERAKKKKFQGFLVDYYLGQALASTGDYASAIKLAEPLVQAEYPAAMADLIAFDYASYLLNNGDREEARAEFRKILNDATDPLLQCVAAGRLAHLAIQTGDVDLADRFGARAVELLPASHLGYVFFARAIESVAHQQTDDKERKRLLLIALKQYNSGLSVFGGDAALWASRAELLLQIGQDDAGIASMKQAARLGHRFISRFVTLMREQRRIGDARRFFNELSAERPDDADVLRYKGDFLFLVDEYAKARTAYFDAYNLEPSFKNLRLLVVRGLLPTKNYGRAIKYLKRGIKRGGHREYKSHNLLGDVYAEQGDSKSAIQSYRMTIKKADRPTVEMFTKLANAQMAEKSFDSAQETLESASAQAPNAVEVSAALAKLYVQTNRTSEAIDLLIKAISKNPRSSVLKTALIGDVLIETGGCKLALPYLNEFNRTENKDAYTLQVAAKCNEKAGNKKKAVLLYEELLPFGLSNFSYFEALAMAYLEINDFRSAYGSFLVAHHLNPNHAGTVQIVKAFQKKGIKMKLPPVMPESFKALIRS